MPFRLNLSLDRQVDTPTEPEPTIVRAMELELRNPPVIPREALTRRSSSDSSEGLPDLTEDVPPATLLENLLVYAKPEVKSAAMVIANICANLPYPKHFAGIYLCGSLETVGDRCGKLDDYTSFEWTDDGGICAYMYAPTLAALSESGCPDMVRRTIFKELELDRVREGPSTIDISTIESEYATANRREEWELTCESENDHRHALDLEDEIDPIHLAYQRQAAQYRSAPDSTP